MRRSKHLNLLASAFTVFALISPAFAGDCVCQGRQVGPPFKGGNGQPLNWVYEEYLISATPPSPVLICYHKVVENNSAMVVRDVGWEVANFYRNFIRKNEIESSCSEVPGELKPTPATGPLVFGPGSDRYDTTVFQPKNGWDQAAAEGNKANLAAIRTVLAFDIINADDVPTPVVLTFEGTARNRNNSSEIEYKVENDSDTSLSVLVNVTASKTIIEKVPFIQASMELPAHAQRSFPVTEDGRAAVVPGLIVVYDSHGRINALDSGGFYTVSGVLARSNRSFWESLKPAP
jgi:hypothetical protein